MEDYVLCFGERIVSIALDDAAEMELMILLRKEFPIEIKVAMDFPPVVLDV